MTTELSSI